MDNNVQLLIIGLSECCVCDEFIKRWRWRVLFPVGVPIVSGVDYKDVTILVSCLRKKDEVKARQVLPAKSVTPGERPLTLCTSDGCDEVMGMFIFVCTTTRFLHLTL